MNEAKQCRQDMDDQHSVDDRHMEHVPLTCKDQQ